MRSSSSKLILSLLVPFVLLVLSSSVEGRGTRVEDEDEKLLRKMLDAVELGLGFFSSDFSNINLDGLFGLRLGQGQIIEALRECQSSRSCPAQLQRRLQSLKDDIEVTAQAALNYVKAKDADYLRRFAATVNRPYLMPYTPVTFTDLHVTPPTSDVRRDDRNGDSYDEEKGDDCFSRLLGTYMDHGKPVTPCDVTEDCWAMMTERHRSGYVITHQILYFILLQKQRCLKLLENKVEFNITETQICRSVYNEAVSEVKDGGVSEVTQDLFLEQVLFCGCLGFENFLRADWMRMVLTWQKATGCFSVDDPALLATGVILSGMAEEERQLMKDLKWEAQRIESQHRGRKLQREQLLNDGCLSHKSGLGFGTLCLYTRYLIRQQFHHQ